MLDKNGVEIRVGDVVRHSYGDENTILKIDPSGGESEHSIRSNGVALGTGKSVYWEIIRRDDGTDPREPEVVKTTGTTATPIEEIDWPKWHLAQEPKGPFQWQQRQAAPTLPKPSAPAKSPAELYADFHRIVTDTVAREAPKVKVVTDFTEELGLYWLSYGKESCSHVMNFSRIHDLRPEVLGSIDYLRSKVDPLR